MFNNYLSCWLLGGCVVLVAQIWKKGYKDRLIRGMADEK